MTNLARTVASAVCFVSWLVAGTASAQSTGYELALSGTPVAMAGEHLRLAGTVYEVQGLASLRPLPQATTNAAVYVYRENNRRELVVQGAFVADREGRVGIDLELPNRPLPANALLVIDVGRRGDERRRTFEFGLNVSASYRFDVISDRQRYEPGETIHAFALLRHQLSGVPVSDAAVQLVVRNPSGTTIHESRVATRASGAIFADVALGTEAADGTYGIQVTYSGPGGTTSATRSVQVGVRTVERMLLDVEVARPVVAPGTAIAGRARVRTASGAPIAGATVTVRAAGNVETYQSDAEGVVAFSVLAPAFLAGDVENQTIEVRAEHPAYGMRRETAAIVVARSPYRIEVVEHGNALVPEVATRVYVHVTDPLGRPAPEGLELEVVGSGVLAGRQVARVDRDGFAEVPMFVPVGAASTLREEGQCQGEFGVRFDVTLAGASRMTASGCAVVAPDAMVSVHATSSVVAPGSALTLEIARRPAASGLGVLVDVLFEHRIVASVFVPANQGTARIDVPREIAGWLELRARPLGAPDLVPAATAEGAVAYGTGSSDAVFARPADAFAMTLDAGTEVLPVRGRATVQVRTTTAPTRAFYTMVARDLAQHGGETDYTIAWLVRFFDAAATSPAESGRDRLVRAALTAAIGHDSVAHGVAPLVQRPWDTGDYGSTAPLRGRGELRDPLRERDELLRRGAAQHMVQIEQLVAQEIGIDDENERHFTLRGGGFPPDLIARMIEQGVVDESSVATLGGRPMTLAMLESADPAFRFQNVAARLCRARLAKLMLSLLALTNPDDANSARAVDGVPPSRWLSRLVELGMVEPDEMLDPWGRAFVFRPAAGGTPRVVLSDRSPTFELVSAGPDGRAGSADDVRDPFRRILPEGSPYAVASGEDEIMKAIAALAPASATLQAMLTAYDTMSLAALDEQRASVITATASEAVFADGESFDDMMPSAPSMAGGMGSGSGYGRGGGMLSSRAMAAPMVRQEGVAGPPAPPEPNAQAGSTLARVGEMVRERFPATLLFVGERPLEGTSSSIEIPLADALTTYRVEAIAWTASGWMTSAQTEFRVDQDATIDAAVPEFATIGDALRVPLRIENRGRTPLRVRVGIEAEGLSVTGGEVRTLEVPARGVLEEIYPLTVSALGSGQLVVRLVRDSDGGALDAVRRPITVYADARLVRETRRFFVEGPTTVELDVPADASERGPGELRIATGFDFFGALPAEGGPARLERAWARSLAGLEVSAEDRTIAVDVLEGLLVEHAVPDGFSGDIRIVWNDPTRLARALALAWRAPGFDAALGRLALERLAADLPETNDRGNNYEPVLLADAKRLLALAPIVRADGPNSEDLALLVGRLRALVENASARSSDSPQVAVLQAAALAWTRGGSRDARADELLRRLDRLLIRSGDGTFLEGADVGQPHARELPTALLALAYIGQGDRGKAFDALRGLATRPERTLVEPARVFAAAAAGRLLAGAAPGGVESDPSVSVDGTAVPLVNTNGVRTAAVTGLGRPGTHRLAIGIPASGAAWIELDVRYGRPWTGAEARRSPVHVALEGELGSRDTRAGLALVLRNDGARVLREPVVEIDLPAGAELDEPARRALAQWTRTIPTIEGRTLRLALRALPPGGRMRLPIGIRWTVGGTARGLGVTAYDAAPNVGGVVARAILPSRVVELADHGTEPVGVDPSVDSPPPTPTPPPVPLPMLRTLEPAREVTR